MIVPKKITLPMGCQSPEFPNIIGITPIEAAAEVKKIGLIRRLALINIA